MNKTQSTLEEVRYAKHHPQEQYEYVDVTFTAADTDVLVPYTIRPNSPNEIRWIDVTPSGVYNGSVDTHPRVYCSASPSRRLWTRAHIVLRSTVAGYSTRLMLFTEHS